MALILDSGAISALTERSKRAAALHQAIRDENLWPPIDVDPTNPTGVENDVPVYPQQ